MVGRGDGAWALWEGENPAGTHQKKKCDLNASKLLQKERPHTESGFSKQYDRCGWSTYYAGFKLSRVVHHFGFGVDLDLQI